MAGTCPVGAIVGGALIVGGVWGAAKLGLFDDDDAEAYDGRVDDD